MRAVIIAVCAKINCPVIKHLFIIEVSDNDFIRQDAYTCFATK